MTQHILHGRPAAEVIDELEQVFAAEYQALAGPEAGTPPPIRPDSRRKNPGDGLPLG
jgi:hypothetical protein